MVVQLIHDGRKSLAFALLPRHIMIHRERMIVVVAAGAAAARAIVGRCAVVCLYNSSGRR